MEKTEFSAAFQEASDMVFAHRSGGKWQDNPHQQGTEAHKGWEEGEDFALYYDDNDFDD